MHRSLFIYIGLFLHVCGMGWLRCVGSIKLYVSFAEYSLFYRALLQKRPIILSILLTVATPYLLTSSSILRSSSCVYVCEWVHIHIYLNASIYICVNICRYVYIYVYEFIYIPTEMELDLAQQLYRHQTSDPASLFIFTCLFSCQ